MEIEFWEIIIWQIELKFYRIRQELVLMGKFKCFSYIFYQALQVTSSYTFLFQRQ